MHNSADNVSQGRCSLPPGIMLGSTLVLSMSCCRNCLSFSQAALCASSSPTGGAIPYMQSQHLCTLLNSAVQTEYHQHSRAKAYELVMAILPQQDARVSAGITVSATDIPCTTGSVVHGIAGTLTQRGFMPKERQSTCPALHVRLIMLTAPLVCLDTLWVLYIKGNVSSAGCQREWSLE